MDHIDDRSEGWRPRSRSDRLLPGPAIWVSRGLIYLSLLFLAASGVWASVARLDVVVEARGRLVVRGQPIEITAAEAALVIDVPARVGAHVEAGDVLVRLDAFVHESEVRRLQREIENAKAEATRHLESVRSLAEMRFSTQAELEAIEAVIALEKEGVERALTLERQGVASRSRVRVEEQELFEVRARRARTTTTLARLKHDVAERRRLAADAQDDIQPMLVRLERAQELVRRATIRAPVAGTLVRLAVLHPGSVMGTGEPVVVLEPDDQPLLARVDVPNASMRRLREGLAGRIELDAFPREDFGHIRGEVLDIEPDADDTGRYRAWIQLTPDATTNETLVRGLKPGLHLDVRLIVERRRIIDFLARPLRKLSGPLTVTE